MTGIPATRRLRDETSELHERVERAVDLPARCRSAAGYRELLLRMLGFYEPLDDRLGRFAWPAGLDFETRRKAAWLRSDLAALGMNGGEIEAAPRCASLPEPPDLAGAFGCLYVVEGSSLGGRIIAGEVGRALGIGPETGGRFFAGYGEDTGRRWNGFRAAADAFCGEDEDRIASALAGAKATFESFEEWLRR